jgi:hypothetical protein
MLHLNLSVICRMNLEVVKMFTPHFAWRSKISARNFVRQLYTSHSSSASMKMYALEYLAATDRRAFEILLSDGRVPLSLCLL